MSLKNIAIIGAHGFIGKHLIDNLSQKHKLRLFLFGKSELSSFETVFPYTKIDLSNSTEISKQFANIDLVYYLASESIPSSSWENPTSEIENNLIPFINFLESIAKTSVKKTVFISSAGTIYGTSNQKVTEESNKKPFSPHGIIKLTMEHFLNYYELKYNLKFDIYRLSNVYGEGQNTSKGLGIINTFIEKIIFNNEITIFGNGENVRNYVYVKDVVKLLSSSIYASLNKSNVYNLSSNETITINELVAIIKRVVSEEFQILNKNKRQSDNLAIYPDNSKILSDYPEFKFTPIEEGILKTYLFIKENKKK